MINWRIYFFWREKWSFYSTKKKFKISKHIATTTYRVGSLYRMFHNAYFICLLLSNSRKNRKESWPGFGTLLPTTCLELIKIIKKNMHESFDGPYWRGKQGSASTKFFILNFSKKKQSQNEKNCYEWVKGTVNGMLPITPVSLSNFGLCKLKSRNT